MTDVAVIAHRDKRLGAASPADLRKALFAAGVTEPQWFEVPKSKYAPDAVGTALDRGARLVFAWGGDGMVQRCVDVLAGGDAHLAIVPAGTANLLATNLGVPLDLAGAVDVGLHGQPRSIDLGKMNGEHFAVMAGTGFDARMIGAADRRLKEKLGQLAYVWSGTRALRAAPVRATVDVDGTRWFEGDAGCVLLGNVSTISGGLTAFTDAAPDDGLLDVAVVSATSVSEWLRVLARTAIGRAEQSPFVLTTKARNVDVRLGERSHYELDGGERPPTKRLKVRVQPGALTVRVPQVAA